MFYVYRHVRLDTNQPFYVGKGCKKRAFSKDSRNYYWKNIAKKAGVKVEILRYFKENDSAYAFEQSLIKLYKKYGLCEANFSDGGAGRAGYKLSDSAKKKIAVANSGKNNGMFNATGSKNPSYGSGNAVICLNTGEYFTSSFEAQEHLNVTNVAKVANGFREQSYGLYFEFACPNLRNMANNLRMSRYLKCKRKKKKILAELLNIYRVAITGLL